MPVRFHDELKLRPPRLDSQGELEVDQNGHVDHGGVDAAGPVDEGDTVQELCAWVFQQQAVNEVAATEMTTSHHGPGGDLELSAGEWKLKLGKIGDVDLVEGKAFAVAVALIKEPSERERVIWWGHPVTLKNP
jgi:hypothetical protein